MTLRAREQDRAHTALGCIAKLGVSDRESYQRRAQELPGMIQNLGLAATLAFLLDKGASDAILANHLGQWLLSGDASIAWPGNALKSANIADPDQAGVDLPSANIVDPNRAGVALQAVLCWKAQRGPQATSWLVYMQAQREAQLFSMWLKRWSKAGLA